MNELRALFAIQVVRGGLLRSDGVGVGLVVGGAPQWELAPRQARAHAAADYHRLLLALDAPLDIYVFDQPHDVADEVAELLVRQERALAEGRRLHAAVLGEICDYLHALEQHTSSRSKQVVWAVTSEGAAAGLAGPPSLTSLLRGDLRRKGAGAETPGRPALTAAIERARRLVEALSILGGTPSPRLMEREEIVMLLYRQADPVRSERYPLAGALLDRVRRIVGA
ncbi:MAG: hypothetical protein DIU80_003435 [Chloroflexota bacterium]